MRALRTISVEYVCAFLFLSIVSHSVCLPLMADAFFSDADADVVVFAVFIYISDVFYTLHFDLRLH